jgi:large subunit ribosomal protein L20
MRIKAGTTTHKRHKEVLDAVKGHRLSRSRHYKAAHEEYMHAEQYAYEGRKLRKRDFRRLWIQRINAGLSQIDNGPSYSVFVNLMKQKQVLLNRKTLAYLATNEFDTFKTVVAKVWGEN